MRLFKQQSRGDTIVEVILAMALLTMVLFTAWGSTNRSSQVSLNSRKRVVMVNALKEQAEILRNQRDFTAGADFTNLINPYNIASSVTVPSNSCQALTGGNPAQSFYLESTPSTPSTVVLKPGVKTVAGDPNAKVWLQAKKVDNGAPGTGISYYDFYINSCWLTVGGVQKEDNAQLLVRLNL